MLIGARITKVENGFIVAVTELEYGADGRQPQESVYIKKDLNEVVEFLKEVS